MTRTFQISLFAGVSLAIGTATIPASLSSSDVPLSAVAVPGSSVSDRNMKENFELVNPADVLDRVMAMPISTWNYRNQNDSIRHMGPMAQDFWPAFGLGEDKLRINTVDADGVALAAIQGLGRQLNDTADEIEVLHNEFLELREQMVSDPQPADGGIAGTFDRFFAIHGNTFQPRTNSIAFLKDVSGTRATGAGFVQFFAPVHLPHGAVVTGLQAQIVDNSAAQNISFQLAFFSESGAGGGMASLVSSGSSLPMQTLSTSTITQGATIDNKSRCYYVNCSWTVPSPDYDIKLNRVEVSYTITEPLP